jgi:hypothetical protein
MKIVTKEFDCKLNPAENCTVHANIGGGDSGSIAVKKTNGQTVSADDTLDCEIGKGSDIIGKKILITSTISDIRPDLDSVLEIIINNELFKVLTETVVDHELIVYSITINFISK